MSLSWNASSGATSYNVKRSTTSGSAYSQVASSLPTALTDSGLANGTTYFYVVSAVNSNGESANSIEASAKPMAGGNAPAAPTGLSASAGNQQVSLSWNASSGATSYNIKRSTTTTAFTDTGLLNGTTCFYVVSAVNSNGESGNSSEASAKPMAAGNPPATPTGLSASGGNQHVSLSWNASSGAGSYNVKRSTTSGSGYSQVASSTTTAFTDTGLVNGTTYYYFVSAVNSYGESGNSIGASAKPMAGTTGATVTVTPDTTTLPFAQSLDVFDIHAYADAGPTNGLNDQQLRAPTTMATKYYWDPATVNPDINNNYTTREEPTPGMPFIIPRFKAMVNAIYPGTPLSFTEWGAGAAPNSGWDFSTAIADADTLGVFGREGLGFGSLWGGPSAAQPSTTWKIFTNYDGAHHRFGTVSVSAQHNANPDLFGSYAALDSTGNVMRIMVLNKDDSNSANVTFNLNGFNASTYKCLMLAAGSGSLWLRRKRW